MIPWLVSVILSLAPGIQAERAHEVAVPIAIVAGDDREGAAILVVTAWRESTFRREVETCAILGDEGRAISAYQLHQGHLWGHSRREVCSDTRLATELAYGALRARHEGEARSIRIARFMGRSRSDPEVRRRVVAVQRAMAIESPQE
jgi:hypothetical protein